MKPVIYLSGPISGRVGGNKEAFAAEQKRQEALGNLVINPHELVNESGEMSDVISKKEKWQRAMRVCLRNLVDCDAVVALDGWRSSEGADAEVYVAGILGIPVHYQTQHAGYVPPSGKEAHGAVEQVSAPN